MNYPLRQFRHHSLRIGGPLRAVIAASLIAAVTAAKGWAAEAWPDTSDNDRPTTLSSPFEQDKGRVYVVKIEGLFFSHRSDLDRYLASLNWAKPERLNLVAEMASEGQLRKLDRGRSLLATGPIRVDGGPVRDSEYGDGFLRENWDILVVRSAEHVPLFFDALRFKEDRWPKSSPSKPMWASKPNRSDRVRWAPSSQPVDVDQLIAFSSQWGG